MKNQKAHQQNIDIDNTIYFKKKTLPEARQKDKKDANPLMRDRDETGQLPTQAPQADMFQENHMSEHAANIKTKHLLGKKEPILAIHNNQPYTHQKWNAKWQEHSFQL